MQEQEINPGRVLHTLKEVAAVSAALGRCVRSVSLSPSCRSVASF